ncbi:MAG: polyprenyl synthetase family protein [Deltaproteobacteria bacterium]|nr:polyprenyl synthetase family protein [Deltaproteobacteria bacterium]
MTTESIKERIINLVQGDLDDIETALEANLTPHLDLVRDAARHILFAGGKRLRPLLMVICARLCGETSKKIKRFSVMVEYLHAATLLHDDLVDQAMLRRGKTAAYRVFGNETAVLTGDFLLARALSLAADTELISVIRIVSDITEQMSQGEIEQLHNIDRVDLTESEYLEVIRRKTAVLIQGACQVGALVAGADKADVQALKTFGANLGLAFQMADDLLDYTAETDSLGKTVGADLKDGKLTLPVIAALKNAPSDKRAWMIDTIKSRSESAATFTRFKSLLATYGGISYTRDKAGAYVLAAKAALSQFGPGREKKLLEDIADYSLARRI